MHVLSQRLRSEFLAIPQLVRITMAQGSCGLEPTLLIKASSLELKYLIQLQRLNFMLIRLPSGKVGYVVRIDDDAQSPALVWSALELEDERCALRAMVTEPQFVVFLYNELVVNVAWTSATIIDSAEKAIEWIDSALLGDSQDGLLRSSMMTILDDHLKNRSLRDVYVFNAIQTEKWKEIRNHYITNQAENSLLSVFEPNEGNQQEEAILWLVDQLSPKGVLKNPTVQLNSGQRELCGLLLTHSYGSILFESKVLSILTRKKLPPREKLTRDLSKHVVKAERQLSGAIRSLKANYSITNEVGASINVERDAPPHAIILVPDLSLLAKEEQLGSIFLRNFLKGSGGFLQILDLKELLRMVQAAEEIERYTETHTRIMCFDYYLLERFKLAMKQDTPYFDLLLRIEEE